MPAAEIPWRAWRMARSRVERYRPWSVAEDLPLGAIWRGECSTDLFRLRVHGFPPVPDESVLAEWRESTIAEAEELLAHQASFFALQREPLGDRIDWNRDYSSGKRVPTNYAPSLDYRNPDEVGDVKYIWELGRMQHLTRLAQAWRFTRDERFAQEIVEQISEWIDQCPHMMGIHWTSPMETGLRLISWTWAFHLIRDWPGIDDEFCGLLICSVHQHLLFIDRNYSLFSSANNHLIAEASGAFVAASYWMGLRCSDRIRRRARKHLIRECERQNFTDGVNNEQTFGYDFFVWDLLLIPALMARSDGEDFPIEYWDRLERKAEFLAWVSDCQGNTPNVGDEDDGLAVNLGGDHRRPILGLIDTAATVWQRDDFRRYGGDVAYEKTAWLLGTSNLSRQECSGVAAGTSSKRNSRSFYDGGYHVFREGSDSTNEVLLVFDAGPMGEKCTAAHGHADALSLCLHVGGEPILIDPGTYSYQDTPRRHYYRATAQHNTLCFGEMDQGEYLNRFLWGKRPRVTFERGEVTAPNGMIQASVDWWFGARHARRLEWESEQRFLRIIDQWQGEECPSIRFHLDPRLSASMLDRICVVKGTRSEVRILNPEFTGYLEEYETSPNCYHREQALRLCFDASEKEGKTVTEIQWAFC